MENNPSVMIDTAHDFGCMGPTGKGCWEGVL
jgi:7-keto-8-aminopelargonate synthetase-like enzyme